MEIEIGTRVGLNKARRAYYFQGANGINLREGIQDTAIIPDDITVENLDIIKKSIQQGVLVLGWSPELKPEVKYKEDDRGLLEKGVKKMVPFLEEIAKTPGKGDDAPVARLEKLLQLEKADKNRKTIIEKIEELLGSMSGISVLEEEGKEEIKIDVIQ